MSVSDKDIALINDPGSLQELATQGYNNHIFEFKRGGQDYILKELKMDTGDYEVFGHNPVKVAVLYNQIYDLARKYFGESLVETYFLVAKNRAGQPTVITVHTKVEGNTLFEIVKRGDGLDAVKAARVADDFDKKWSEVKSDDEWKKLPEKVQFWFAKLDFAEYKNIVVTSDQRYVLIDL